MIAACKHCPGPGFDCDHCNGLGVIGEGVAPPPMSPEPFVDPVGETERLPELDPANPPQGMEGPREPEDFEVWGDSVIVKPDAPAVAALFKAIGIDQWATSREPGNSGNLACSIFVVALADGRVMIRGSHDG